jgi:hypothetical protein
MRVRLGWAASAHLCCELRGGFACVPDEHQHAATRSTSIGSMFHTGRTARIHPGREGAPKSQVGQFSGKYHDFFPVLVGDRFRRSSGTSLIALEKGFIPAAGVLREYLIPDAVILESRWVPFTGRLVEFFFLLVQYSRPCTVALVLVIFPDTFAIEAAGR